MKMLRLKVFTLPMLGIDLVLEKAPPAKGDSKPIRRKLNNYLDDLYKLLAAFMQPT